MPDLLTLQSNLKLLKFKDFSEEDPYVLKSITSTDVYQRQNKVDFQFEKRADDLQRMFKLLKDRPGIKFIGKLGVLSVLEYEDKPLRVAEKVLKNVAGTLAGILSQASLSGTGFHFSVDQATGNLYVKASSFKKSKTIYNDNKVDRSSGDINQGLPLSFKSVLTKLKSEFSPIPQTDSLLNLTGTVGLSSPVPGQIIRQLQSEDKLKQTIKTSLNYSGEIGSGLDSYKNTKPDTPVRLEGDFRNPNAYYETIESAERDLIQNSQIFNNETNDFGGNPSIFSTYSAPSPITQTAVNKLTSYKDKPATESQNRTLGKIDELINRPYPTDYLTGDLHNYDIPRSNKRTIRYSGTLEGSDRINLRNVLRVEYGKSAVQSDFIPFEFAIYEPGKGKVDRVYFRAYIDDFSDSYNAEWNSTKYVGRGESVYVYNGFKRDITLGFKIAASSKVELLPIYRKLNFLVGSTAPAYANSFMRGVFVRLTVGDYFYDIPGFFTTVGTSWQTNYPWDIARGTAGIEDVLVDERDSLYLPHVLDVKTTFVPIHSFVPAYRQPFIGKTDILGEDSVSKDIVEGIVTVDDLKEELFNGEDRSKRTQTQETPVALQRPLTPEQSTERIRKENEKKLNDVVKKDYTKFNVEDYRKVRSSGR